MQALTVSPSLDWKNIGFIKREMPEPVLDEHTNPEDAEWVILKPHFAGVCGTDRGIWYRQSFGDAITDSLQQEGKETRIIGHECFGEIVAIGSKVEEKFGLKVGQMVAAESHIVCNECYQCTHGQKEVCSNELIMGITINGCFAEYVKLPAHIIWPTNTELIRPEVACMQEPFGNGVHAATKVDLQGQSVAILGCGPIGLFSVLIAKAHGAAHIIAIDPVEKSRELAKKFGADHALDTEAVHGADSDEALVAKIKELTGGVGVDVAMEMAGFHISVINALKVVRRGGHVILFGLKSGPITIPDFDRLVIRSGITLHGIIGRELFRSWETTRSLLENHDNNVQHHLWHDMLQEGNGTILNFSDFETGAFEAAMNHHPKILIRF